MKAARPLRVVYLGHTARLSGAELALLRLLPHLEEVAPHVLLAENGPLTERLRRLGAAVEVLPLAESARALERERLRPSRLGAAAPVFGAVYTLRLARRLRALRPHLVHANTLKSWVYGAPAAALAGVPVLWHVHDRIAPDYLPGAAVTLVRALGRRFPAAIVTNSAATLSTIGDVRAPTAIIPYPVTEHARTPGEPRSSFVVGMVGRIAPWKGQDIFIRAMAEAFPGGSERAVLVGAPLFGEDAYERELRALTARLELDGRVEFRGFREDVTSELAAVDVLVHASILPEPFGQVVAEGMAAGLPVVAPRAGGPAEMIEDGATGLLYPPGDVGALAARLRSLAGAPALRRRLGAAARERALAFRPQAVADQIMAVYRQVEAQRSAA